VSAHVPADASQGFAAPGFERVREAFECNFRDRGELGAAFCAVVDGETVVDLWGGMADSRRGVPWRQDTLAVVFSGTKGLVATCMLMLLERGLLELEAPVCRYWPEFGAHGKEGILVRHVLTHTAGLPGLTTRVSAREAADDVRIAQLVAAQAPVSAPGKVMAYHVLTYGWLCGELVRRVDGRSVGRFFREELAEPLGLDAWIGLPSEHESRVAVLEPAADFAGELPSFVAPDAPGATKRDRILWSMLANPPGLFDGTELANSRCWRAGEIPAANGVASARAMARLYGCLACGGAIDGVRVLAQDTLALAARELASGHDPYQDRPMIYSAGFNLALDEEDTWSPAGGYGHGGLGGSHHGAWPSFRTGFSYTMNLLGGAPDPRPAALLAALRDALDTRSVP
jgi:CubicO group peptidase (beta-lactamase class C family)